MIGGARGGGAYSAETPDASGRIAVWTAVTLFVALALFLAVRRDFQVGFFLPDDAFYYLRIAGNASSGSGLSFDGIHATNGFQFLWQMTLIPIVWAARAIRVDVLSVVPFAEAAFVITGTLVLLRTMRILSVRVATAATGALLVLLSPFVLKPLFSGMETAVDFAVLSCLWSLAALIAAGEKRLDRRHALIVGGLGVLAMLARFDNLVLLPALVVAYRSADRDRWVRRTLESGAVVATGLVAYLAWNQLAFGIALPVSGAIKNWQNYPDGFTLGVWWGRFLEMLAQPVDIAWATPGWAALAAAAVLIGIPIIIRLRARRSRAVAEPIGWLAAWTALFAGVGLHVAYLILYLQMHAATFWYYVPEFLALAVLSTWVCERLALRSRILATSALLLLLVAYGALYSTYTFDHARKTRFAILPEVGAWIDKTLPADARIGSWNAGAPSYFSNRTVVNLDGLVNDVEYFRNYLKTGRTADYLERERIDYIVEYFPDPQALESSGYGYRTIKVFPYRIDERSLFQRGGTSHEEYYVIAERAY